MHTCPPPACPMTIIHESCRRERYTIVNGRRCKGCDIDMCAANSVSKSSPPIPHSHADGTKHSHPIPVTNPVSHSKESFPVPVSSSNVVFNAELPIQNDIQRVPKEKEFPVVPRPVNFLPVPRTQQRVITTNGFIGNSGGGRIPPSISNEFQRPSQRVMTTNRFIGSPGRRIPSSLTNEFQRPTQTVTTTTEFIGSPGGQIPPSPANEFDVVGRLPLSDNFIDSNRNLRIRFETIPRAPTFEQGNPGGETPFSATNQFPAGFPGRGGALERMQMPNQPSFGSVSATIGGQQMSDVFPFINTDIGPSTTFNTRADENNIRFVPDSRSRNNNWFMPPSGARETQTQRGISGQRDLPRSPGDPIFLPFPSNADSIAQQVNGGIANRNSNPFLPSSRVGFPDRFTAGLDPVFLSNTVETEGQNLGETPFNQQRNNVLRERVGVRERQSPSNLNNGQRPIIVGRGPASANSWAIP